MSSSLSWMWCRAILGRIVRFRPVVWIGASFVILTHRLFSFHTPKLNFQISTYVGAHARSTTHYYYYCCKKRRRKNRKSLVFALVMHFQFFMLGSSDISSSSQYPIIITSRKNAELGCFEQHAVHVPAAFVFGSMDGFALFFSLHVSRQPTVIWCECGLSSCRVQEPV